MIITKRMMWVAVGIVVLVLIIALAWSITVAHKCVQSYNPLNGSDTGVVCETLLNPTWYHCTISSSNALTSTTNMTTKPINTYPIF